MGQILDGAIKTPVESITGEEPKVLEETLAQGAFRRARQQRRHESFTSDVVEEDGRARELFKSRESATFFEKAKTSSRNWDYDSVLGYSMQVASGNTVDDDEFEQEEGYKVPPHIAIELNYKAGGEPEDVHRFMRAKSDEHKNAIYNQIERKSKLRQITNSTLTPREQAIGNAINGIVDYDTIATAGIGVIPKVTKLAMLMSGGSKARLAFGVGAMGFTKPFVREYIQDTHTSFEAKLIEGTIGAVAESLSIKLMAKEIDATIRQVSNAIPSKDSSELIIEASKKNIEEFDNVSNEIVDKILKREEPAPIVPKTKDDILGEGATIRTTKTSTTVGSTVEDKLFQEVPALNARQMELDATGKTPNQGTKYYREVKKGLQEEISSNGQLLKKDETFMQHLTNKDYESALLRAQEMKEEVAKASALAKVQKEAFDTRVKNAVEEMTVPRPASLDEIAEALDMVEEDLITKGVQTFNKNDLNIELSMFQKSKDGLDGFITRMRNVIQESNMNPQLVKEAVEEISMFVDESLELVGTTLKLSKTQLDTFSKVMKNQLEELVTVANKTEDGFKVSAKDMFIRKLKWSYDFVKKNMSPTSLAKAQKMEARIAKLQDAITEIAKNIKSTKALGKSAKELEAKKAKLINEAKETKATLDAFSKTEADKIANKVEKEFDNGIKIKRVGDKFEIGKYKIPLAVGAVALGSNAFAGGMVGSEDGTSTDGYISAGLGLMLVVGAISAMRGKSLFSKTAKAFVEKSTDAVGKTKTQFVAHKKMSKALKEDLLVARTQLTETFAPLKKYATRIKDKELEDFFDAIIFNGVRGNKDAAELTKSRYVHQFLPKYIAIEADLFAKWRKARGITIGATAKKKFDGDSFLYEFRIQVSLAQAGKTDMLNEVGKEFVEQMAQNSKKMIDDILKDAKEVGVEGADTIKEVVNYLTRRMAKGFSSILNHVDEAGFAQIKELFKNMHKKAISKRMDSLNEITKTMGKVADSFVDIDSIKKFIDANTDKITKAIDGDDDLEKLFAKFKKADNVADAKEAYLKLAKGVRESTTEKAIDKKITKYLEVMKKEGYSEQSADVFGSFKSRIPLDMDGFYDIPNLNVVDGKRNLSLTQVFELDNFELFDRYISSVAARIGLKQSGYQISKAKQLINNIKDPDVKMIAENAFNSLIGRPVIENLTTKTAETIQLINNIASGTLLVTSPISLIVEATMATARAILNPREGIAVINSIKNQIVDSGSDSLMFRTFSNKNGFGVGHKMGGAHLRGESFSALDVDAKGGFGVDASKTFRDTIMNTRGVGISFWSSQIENVNFIMNNQRLMDVALGKTKLSPLWMTKYGIDDVVLAIAKKYLKPNKYGFTKDYDLSTVPVVDRNRLHNVLFNMNQFGAQRSTIGGTAPWGYSNALGSMFMKLMSYTMNSFSNLGVPIMKGFGVGDFDAMIGGSAIFFGGFLSSQIRDVALGKKEKTTEEYMQYALMQMPFFAPAQILGAFVDPTVPAGLERGVDNMGNFTKMMLGGSY